MITDPAARRKVALAAAAAKRGGGITKNVMELQTLPGAAVKAPPVRFVKLKGVPAKGPSSANAGMNSSSSGSAMGPAYMR